LWIKKESLAEAELALLCWKITAATYVEMEFEGRYHWIDFARSKQNSKWPVAARYFRVFTDGSPKIRGFACMVADTPKFIKAVQEGLLSIASERSLDTLARQT
jgi:DNA polymerase elongation subunit (family B)